MQTLKLYPHTTDGGAEYLLDQFIQCNDGHKEGVCRGAKIIVRLDGEPEVRLSGEYEAAQDLLEHLKRMVNIATHPKATKAAIKIIAQDAMAAIRAATGE